jgi:CubicO group peptidase (beta-lactamase class C family)
MLCNMKRRLRSLFLVGLLGMGLGTLGLADRSAPELAARIEKLVSRYAEFGHLNGTVLLARHGTVIYAKGIGDANMQSHTPNTPRTKFGIASVTKQFTAVLVLQQVAEGKIRLDGKTSDYLAWYREDTGSRMTIEQVLHHTAGLPPDFELPEFSDSEAAKQHFEPEEFAKKKCQPSLVSEPGTQWNYSNCGYLLLGLVLEQVTGKPFDELLQERLLEPLGMKDTGMDRNDLAERGGATGYLRHAGARYTVGPYLDRSHIYAAGAMYSTAEDLFRWNQALSDGGVIPKEIREQVFRPGLGNWGYGWFITKIPAGTPGEGNTIAEMRGDMPGNYFSWILRYPEKEAVIIVLRNGYGSTERLEENLQAILFDAEPRMPSRSLKDLAAQAWWTPEEWVSSHRRMSAILLVIVMGMIRMVLRRRKKYRINGIPGQFGGRT